MKADKEKTGAATRHFLDTSIARSLLTGTRAYKEYCRSQFNGRPAYVDNYILMELRRSWLATVIEFYFVLHVPAVETVGDACALWSDKFSTAALKGVLQLVGQLIDTHRLSNNNPADKPKALAAIASYINRFEGVIKRRFRNIGATAVRCSRGTVTLEADPLDPAPSFRRFQEAFRDVTRHRLNCNIGNFLLDRHLEIVRVYASGGESLPKNEKNNGFKKISLQLADVVKGGADSCSCKRCEKSGDAVIVLAAPRDMRLEHSDYSHDHLCPPANQPHCRHISQAAFMKREVSQTKGRAEGSPPAGPID